MKICCSGYGAAGVFGGSSNFKTSSGERWRCSHTLKGHTGGEVACFAPYFAVCLLNQPLFFDKLNGKFNSN